MEYKVKLNLKSICLFEYITNSSFYKFDDKYILDLIYAVLVTNNEFNYSLDTFKETYAKNKKFANEINKICTKLVTYLNNMFKASTATPDNSKKVEDSEEREIRISDVANSLIILHGVDAHYVMYEMEIWEISKMLEIAEEKKHMQQLENRFWSFIQLSPYLPSKIKEPQDLVRFNWEVDYRKEKAVKDLEKNKDKILAALS